MKIYQVDAFTDTAYAGNPAGVCILSEAKEDSWLQKVAREMSLPETAFLTVVADGYNLRWFTPSTEIDLCGHATLASAHILWEKGYLDKEKTAIFHTRSGKLTADLSNNWIELNFPAVPETETFVSQELLEALGVQAKYTGKNIFDYIIEVDSEEIVRSMQPDFTQLAKLDARGVIVTSLAQNKAYDFVSRFFAPGIGISEDPVTGSSHCCLGLYWSKRLHKDKFFAYQASERGGYMKVEVAGDRVLLKGQAITVIEGELLY